MFKRLSEDIIFLLIKNKKLDIESYDIYLYAIEVILLNGSILLVCLVMSILLGELSHMLAFILFFIPLRMLVGGYHCKKSELCFICSLGMYGLSMFVMRYTEIPYVNMVIQILAAVLVIVIIIFSPLIHPNHPLEDYQIRRNKKITYGVIAVDFVLYAIFYKFNLTMAIREAIFIIFVAFTFMLGRMEDKKSAL